MARRRHQALNVQRTRTKNGKNDQWFIRYRIDMLDGAGKTEYKEAKPKYLGFCRDIGKREAEKLRDQFLETINAPQLVIPSQVKFGVVVEKYLGTIDVRESSLLSYTSTANAHIFPKWGALRICDITQFDVETWLLQKSRGMCKETFAKLKTVMSNAWNAAIRWGYTRDANPISLLPPNFGRAKKGRTISLPTQEEFQRFIACLEEPWRMAALVMAGTGLRVSEALALRWSDFDADTMTVSQARGRRSRVVTGDLKTDRSSRHVPVGHLRSMMRRPSDAEPDDLIFNTHYEETQRAIVRAAKAAKIYRSGFGSHMLRRWHNTMFRRISGDVQMAMAQLGHGDVATNERYFFAGDKEMVKRAAVAAELMGQVIGGVQ